MATKAGRVEICDIKAGKTFWKAAIDPLTGERYPKSIFITKGARRGRFPRIDGTMAVIWHYMQLSRDAEDRLEKAQLIADPMWTPHLDGAPVFDKLFVNRAAAERWIKRYNSNRVETLCEDRRVFECGSRSLRTVAARHPDQLDLSQVLDHRFQHTELGLARHFGAHRRAVIFETPQG